MMSIASPSVSFSVGSDGLFLRAIASMSKEPRSYPTAPLVDKDEPRRQRIAALLALGRPIKVGIVGCSKTKAETPCPAGEMYQSSLFRAARAYAKTLDEWIIVSAFYGAITPDTVIEPYERDLSALRLSELLAWGERASSNIRWMYRGVPVQYVGLAGESYLSPIQAGLPPIARPLAGMQIGDRVRWLRAMSTEAMR